MKFTDNLRNLIDACGITGAMMAIGEIIECGEDTIDGLSESIKAELGYAEEG